MKMIVFFLFVFASFACAAQSPAVTPVNHKVTEKSNKNAALIPSARKIVVPPKGINKKKRKLSPVTAVDKDRHKPHSNTK